MTRKQLVEGFATPVGLAAPEPAGAPIRIIVGRRGAWGLPDHPDPRAEYAYQALAGGGRLPGAMEALDVLRVSVFHGTLIAGHAAPPALFPHIGRALERHHARWCARHLWSLPLEEVHYRRLVCLLEALWLQSDYRKSGWYTPSGAWGAECAIYLRERSGHMNGPLIHGNARYGGGSGEGNSVLTIQIPYPLEWYERVYRAGYALLDGSIVVDRFTHDGETYLLAGQQLIGYTVVPRLATWDGRRLIWQSKQKTEAVLTERRSARHARPAS